MSSALTPEAALEQAALAGVHCLPLQTPFSIGAVNTYLIEDSPLTLIDAGPNSGKALDELNAQLAHHGHTIDDLELISQEGRTLGELMAEFRARYFISGEINSEVADQAGKLDEIRERYADGEITELDGVSVDYDDWHFNVRSSNTEPLLRLNLESLVSREDMERRRDEVLELIRG